MRYHYDFTQRGANRCSRRAFLGGAMSAVGLSLIGCDTFHSQPVPVQPQAGYIEYHNRSANYHQHQIESLSKQGYRPISLSLYGNTAQSLYAAVWIKRSGTPWYTFHSVNMEQYQQLYDMWTQRGYRPTILTATGSQTTPIFAGVFEQDSTPFVCKHHLATTL